MSFGASSTKRRRARQVFTRRAGFALVGREFGATHKGTIPRRNGHLVSTMAAGVRVNSGPATSIELCVCAVLETDVTRNRKELSQLLKHPDYTHHVNVRM